MVSLRDSTNIIGTWSNKVSIYSRLVCWKYWSQKFQRYLITFIPKTKNPKNPFDWRLISLCNTSYKILSKILSLRLKNVLQNLLDPCQGAFTKGREAQDNALVVLEFFRSILNKDKRLNKGMSCLAIKLDISKAYDRFNFDFLHKTLQDLQFPRNFINIIVKCIISTSIAIKFNGVTSWYFLPSKSLRLGDPISPPLFNMCINCLS